MMNLTPQAQQNLKNLLTISPLGDGEVRRIEGMGELYVSRSSNLDEASYQFLYSIEIEGETHYFFGKLS